MCGIKLKSLAFLLLLSLSLSPRLFSDVVLTEEEHQAILAALKTSQTELTEAQEEIKKLKNLQNVSQLTIMKLDTLLTEQAAELAMLKINSEMQSQSYNRLKQRVNLIWIDRVGFGLLGFGSGYGIKALVEELR